MSPKKISSRKKASITKVVSHHAPRFHFLILQLEAVEVETELAPRYRPISVFSVDQQ